MIVIDASALAELLLGTPRSARFASRVAHPALTMHAPHLIDLEVGSVFRSLEVKRVISPAVAANMVADLARVDLQRYPHVTLLPRVWQLRGNLTTYDAAYVALAEALGAPLATFDANLAAAPGHRARIELYP
ncbi:MAG TPA: type II toxin-antitoxin system VapC family toxin [Kofleriaceae bacterium]|nr:type II toxin-antitoxin system VapC family toxin [Kofleriaceae bacterium]